MTAPEPLALDFSSPLTSCQVVLNTPVIGTI